MLGEQEFDCHGTQDRGDGIAQHLKRRTGADKRSHQHPRNRAHQQITQEREIHMAETQVTQPRDECERKTLGTITSG